MKRTHSKAKPILTGDDTTNALAYLSHCMDVVSSFAKRSNHKGMHELHTALRALQMQVDLTVKQRIKKGLPIHPELGEIPEIDIDPILQLTDKSPR